MSGCRHIRLHGTVDGWECNNCGEEFVPKTHVELVHGTYTDNLDMLAGIMESVIWGLQERAIDKYGIKPVYDGKEEEFPPEHDCEVDPHVFDPDTNKCSFCGAPQFLGADT